MEYHLSETTLFIAEGTTGIGFEDVAPLLDKYAITEIHLPVSCKTIEDDTFFDFPCIRCIVLPDGLRHIGRQAFWGLDDLEELTVPMSVETIGRHAFCNCRRLTLRIPCSPDTIPVGWDRDFAPNVHVVFTAPCEQ